MKSETRRKLVLSTESLRRIDSQELERVGGGRQQDTITLNGEICCCDSLDICGTRTLVFTCDFSCVGICA